MVDDVPENIDILGEVLSEYKRVFALNGQNALEKAKTSPQPDLILLDIMMPDMDGYEVCRHLKADRLTRDIPVIFITAKIDVQDETRAFEFGGADYITKPINPAIVKARVKTHLELKQAHEQLKQQNQELIEAARLREDVERITRHDLKNPLNAIIGLPSTLLETEHLSEEGMKRLKLMRQAGYRMLSMINHSLDIFKMEKGIYRFYPVPVDLVEVLKNVIEEMRALVAKKAVTLNVLVDKIPLRPEHNFWVRGEALLCYSLLSNLIKNAIEASPGGAELVVSCERSDMALVSIINQGLVPREIRERFFEKYVTYGKKSGTGLGSYSSRLIVETLGGLIELHVRDDQNTTELAIQLPGIKKTPE